MERFYHYGVGGKEGVYNYLCTSLHVHAYVCEGPVLSSAHYLSFILFALALTLALALTHTYMYTHAQTYTLAHDLYNLHT